MSRCSVSVSGLASRRVWCRACVAAFGLLIVLAPPLAAESRNRCRKMANQIAHYYGVEATAHSRGDDLWQASTQEHILHLETRYRRLCPKYLAAIERSRIRKATEETKQFIRAAAKAAARYFTFGL